jgi:hypothetical protein
LKKKAGHGIMSAVNRMDGEADIRRVLDEWPYDPEKTIRIVRLPSGRDVLQVRLPLGLEQYEIDGRPDGKRPHGLGSALEYQEARLEALRAEGREDRFVLKPRDCAELFEEGVLYYYRYLHLFQLQDWKRTIRDTARNLRVFDLVNRYAQKAEDREYLEQWRPYIVRMNAVAAAMEAIDERRFTEADTIVRNAVGAIESLPEGNDDAFRYERRRSLDTLRALARQIEASRPVGEMERLERRLRRAVESEEFELAAELRDRILALRRSKAARHG